MSEIRKLEEMHGVKTLGENKKVDIVRLTDEILNDLSNPNKYYERARGHMKNHDWGKALVDFDQVEVMCNPNPLVHCYRGKCFLKIRKLDEAQKEYEKALKLDPNDLKALNGMSLCLLGHNQYSKAFSVAEKGIEIDPEYAESYLSLGNVYRKIENYGAAINEYSLAIKKLPDYHKAFLARAMCYHHEEEHEKALADINEAIKISPKKNYVYNRSIFLMDMKKFKDAVDGLSNALNGMGTNSPKRKNRDIYLFQRGEAYRLMGQYYNALQDYNKALEISPKKNYYLQRKIECVRKLKL